MGKELNSVKKTNFDNFVNNKVLEKFFSYVLHALHYIFPLNIMYLNNEFINITIYMIICQNPIDNCEIYV